MHQNYDTSNAKSIKNIFKWKKVKVGGETQNVKKLFK